MNVQQLRNAWIDWIDEHQWDDYLTVNFNCASTITSGKQQFGKLCQRIDSFLLGPRYRKQVANRTFIIAFPEHVRSNFHYHCLVKYNCIGRGSHPISKHILQYYWKQLVPSGTIHLQDAYDASGAARYSTKECGSFDRLNDIIVSSEFWPSGEEESEGTWLEMVNWSRLRTLRQSAHYANLRRQRLRREQQPGETCR